MTNINLNINPTVPESPQGGESPKLPSVIEGKIDQFGQRVLQLAGPEMGQVPTLAESMDQLHQSLASPQRVYVPSQPVIPSQMPINVAVPAAHSASGPEIGGFGKHVAGGAAITLGVPQAIAVVGGTPATIAMAASGAPLSAWALPFAISAGIPVAGALVGRAIGKKFGRPTTGTLAGIATGVAGAGLANASVGLGLSGTTAAAAGLSLAWPVGIGVAAGAGIYGIRKLMRGR